MLQIPAIRGEMGGVEYFVTVWGLGEVARNLSYTEELEESQEREVTAEMRTQRKINWQRVRKEIVPYLTQVPDHFFSSLTVEVLDLTGERRGIVFKRLDGEEQWGHVLLDGTEILRTLDGQHRLVAIKEALKESPSLAAERISVILIPLQDRRKSQQLFTDLNRNAKPTTKTLNILYEWRGLYEQSAKQSMEYSQFLKDRVELEKNSLARKAQQKVITLGVLYEMSRKIMENRDIYNDDQSSPSETTIDKAAQEIANIFDEIILTTIPELEKVVTKKMTSYDHRSKYIATHSVGWQAIAAGIRAAIDQQPDTWKQVCKEKMAEIDWRITNFSWEGTAVSGGLVANRAPNIRLVTAQIKEFLGLNLTDSEKEYFDRKDYPIKRLTPMKQK